MTKVNLEELALLPVLEHVDFVIGSIAVTATSEAKYELYKLLGGLETDHELADRLGDEIDNLRAADQAFTDRNYRHATVILVGVSQSLWRRILPSLPADAQI